MGLPASLMKHILFRLLAALNFFTRLPFWRIADVPKSYYERVVPLWPLVGWLTGGLMALVFWAAQLVFPLSVSLLLALLARILATGALHEDGFADFCDGFGGGTDRQRTLDIMKDSHIGTYGVLGLILYFLLLFSTLLALAHAPQTGLAAGLIASSATGTASTNVSNICALMVSADAFAKWAGSNIVNALPYARKEQEAKNKLIYKKMTTTEQTLGILFGLLPALCLLPLRCYVAMVVAFAVAMLMIVACHRRLQGYTGDCCGATFIITEAAFYLTVLAVSAI